MIKRHALKRAYTKILPFSRKKSRRRAEDIKVKRRGDESGKSMTLIDRERERERDRERERQRETETETERETETET